MKKDHDGANYFVASMDVSSLFPSLKTESTAKEIKETVLESEITVNDVNWRELGIFLRKNMSSSDIDDCNFCDFIPTKRSGQKNTSKKNIKMTCGSLGQKNLIVI